MNVLFVCVDCLRGDFVDSPHADTPFLDRLVEGGTQFDSMYATATTTTPAVASFLTGRFSEHNGVNSLRDVELAAEATTLATRLSEAGYHTRAMVTGPLVEDTGLDRGFDEYEYREDDEGVFSPWFDGAVERIGSLPEPYFCYLHLWEIHHPIEVPAEFDDSRYGDTEYARGLAAVDRKLATLAEHTPEETVLVLHGDHGESISTRSNPVAKGLKAIRDKLRFGYGLDTRRVERLVNRVRSGHAPYPDHYLEDGHGQAVREFTANVPFVVGGVGDGETVSERVRQVDVYPTFLDLLDVPFDEDRIDGRSLLPAGEVTDRDAYTRGCGESLRGQENWIRSVRTENHRYVEYPDRDWESECYDLTADPDELDPLPESAYDEAAFRQRFVTAELQESARLDIDDRLRDLGYL